MPGFRGGRARLEPPCSERRESGKPASRRSGAGAGISASRKRIAFFPAFSGIAEEAKKGDAGRLRYSGAFLRRRRSCSARHSAGKGAACRAFFGAGGKGPAAGKSSRRAAQRFRTFSSGRRVPWLFSRGPFLLPFPGAPCAAMGAGLRASVRAGFCASLPALPIWY